MPCNIMAGNLSEHLRALEEIRDPNLLKGEPSLQNSLELGRTSLQYAIEKSSNQ